LDEEETETEDMYDDRQREEVLEDEITTAEKAFLHGREMKQEKRKRPIHKTQFQLNFLKMNLKKTESACARLPTQKV
jgi:hypothetical protein